MNGRLTQGLSALLVVGAVIFLFLKVRDSSHESEDPSEGASATSSPAKAPTNRVGAPKNAARDLAELFRARPVSEHRYEDIERLVRSLSDEELHDLIQRVGFDKWEGMPGWLRCALFAEWGRRSPEDSDKMRALVEGPDRDATSVQQALFSFFRGKISGQEVNEEFVVELIEDLTGGEVYPSSEGWTGDVIRELYSAFARNDPETAWRRLPGAEKKPLDKWESIVLNSIRPRALEGFFLGLGNHDDVREYVGRWQEDWNTTEYAARLENYRKNAVLVSFHVPEPVLERVGRAAALAIAEFDLREAEQWLADHAPGNDSTLGTRRYVLQRDWAARNPEAALALLGEVEYSDAHHGLGSGILFADPTRGREVLAAVGEGRAGETALGNAVTDSAHSLQSDAFPTPGGVNRLPNFRERYESLRAAVVAGEFDERTAARMLRQLESGFGRMLQEE